MNEINSIFSSMANVFKIKTVRRSGFDWYGKFSSEVIQFACLFVGKATFCLTMVISFLSFFGAWVDRELCDTTFLGSYLSLT